MSRGRGEKREERREENKNKLKKFSKTLDNQKNMCYNKYNKRKGVGRYDIWKSEKGSSFRR